MRRVTLIVTAWALIAPLALSRPAAALDAPYETGLMRIAEVMGSLHFLRNLCGDKGNQWRQTMERLLAAENPNPERRARFIASFNRGYRSFEGVYTACTASATEAIGRYMKEGETLTGISIINSRFTGTVVRETTIAGQKAIIPSIAGRAWITGTSQLLLDPADPWPGGYKLSDTWPKLS